MEVHLELKKVRPNLKLLYVTPERMSNDYFLPQVGVHFELIIILLFFLQIV